MLEERQPAPDFTLPLDDGEKFTLSEQKGKYVVLYFYPKDNTPGCTTQAQDFTRLLPEFEALNAVVVGISKDSDTSHQGFREKCHLGIKLASDTHQAVSALYGVMKEKDAPLGNASIVRSTFLVNPEGKLAKIWFSVKVEGHAQEVLKTLKGV